MYKNVSHLTLYVFPFMVGNLKPLRHIRLLLLHRIKNMLAKKLATVVIKHPSYQLFSISNINSTDNVVDGRRNCSDGGGDDATQLMLTSETTNCEEVPRRARTSHVEYVV